jgi:folate-binding protein YgfZ
MGEATLPSASRRVAYEGAEVTAAYGDAAAGWNALDAGAGLLDGSWRRFFTAIGEERLDFLHGQTSNDLRSLRAGQGCATLVLTAQGRPLGVAAIYEDGERTWIATTLQHADALRAALSRFLVADDCDFEGNVDAACIVIAGPRAAEVLAAAGAADAASLASWGVAAAAIRGQPVMLFSRGDLRVPCFDILASDAEGRASDGAVVKGALEAAGAVPCGVDAFEIVRVESGTARYGVDVDDKRIAMEARLEWAIHFAKGCYVGQEVVERAVSRGRINHELGLLAVSGAVAVGAHVEGGAEGDVVTSVVTSPRLGRIALAYLPVGKGRAEEGGAVTLRDTGNASAEAVEATVLCWPRRRVLAGRA